MGKQIRWDGFAGEGALRDDIAQLGGIPEDDAGGGQVHAGDAIMLPFAGAIADLATAVKADGTFQGVLPKKKKRQLRRESLGRTGGAAAARQAC